MPDRDERLAALLDQLKDEQRRGLSPNLDAVAGQHPDLADELRQLWAVMQFLSNPPDGDRTVTLPQSVNPPSSRERSRWFRAKPRVRLRGQQRPGDRGATCR